MDTSKKVLFNTGITYLRGVFTAVIALFTTRFVLKALGAEDYGLYNVISGSVTLISFLNIVMSSSTQRYLSYSHGKGDIEETRLIFINSRILHIFIGVLLLILIEVIGLYLIHNFLKLPIDKINIALLLLHFLAFEVLFTVISTPFDALVTSHENFKFLALTSIVENLAKFMIAFSLNLIEGNRLIIYGLSSVLISILLRISKQQFCRINYQECTAFSFKLYDGKIFKKIGSFAGWNLLEGLSTIARNQGVVILLNFFFFTSVNAAYSLAYQLGGQMMYFSRNLIAAIRPQIVKSEGAGFRMKMIDLSIKANKFCFFLFSFFAIPIYFKMSYFLKIWLNIYPEYTLEFCKLIIIFFLIMQLNLGLMIAIQAIGKIKKYQIVINLIQLISMPICYVGLKFKYPPYSIMYVFIIVEIISSIVRVYFFNELTQYPIIKYVKEVFGKSILPLLPVVVILKLIEVYFDEKTFVDFISLSLTSCTIYILTIWFYGLTYSEKQFILSNLRKIKTLRNINILKNKDS